MLEYGQRLTRESRNVLAFEACPSVGGALFSGAQFGGARALGVPPPGLAPDGPADIVCLDADHPSLTGRHGDALLDGWIFAARGGAVESVWRHGRKVVEGGRHIDKDAITEAYRSTLSRLIGA